MRYAVAGLLAIAVVAAVAVALRPSATLGPAGANPSATATFSTPTASSASSPSPEPAGVSIKVTKTSVPAEYHYAVLGSEPDYRLVVLDLDAARVLEVATIRVVRSPNVPGGPSSGLATSADGRTVLLWVVLPDASDSMFLIRPEQGDARLVDHGEFRGGSVSADGSRFAVARNDETASLTGLWVGPTSDGTLRRLVADDPHFNGSPPRPYAFSNDSSLIAFGVGVGDSGAQGFVMSVDAAESRVERDASGELRVAGAEATGPAAGAEFISTGEVFLWSTRNAFGGETVVYIYDLTAKRVARLYRPSGDAVILTAAWRPAAQEYATIERPLCCGVFVPGTAGWLRARDGSARTLGDAVYAGELWWSRSGARLFARLGGDDSVSTVTDLLAGKTVMQFCLRGGGPPPAPCT
ncbi:MAG TPA: hypothetical protein VIA63_05865 [Candidatus Limnocylindria bacterium]|jgi:hypothetical protein